MEGFERRLGTSLEDFDLDHQDLLWDDWEAVVDMTEMREGKERLDRKESDNSKARDLIWNLSKLMRDPAMQMVV